MAWRWGWVILHIHDGEKEEMVNIKKQVYVLTYPNKEKEEIVLRDILDSAFTMELLFFSKETRDKFFENFINVMKPFGVTVEKKEDSQ